MAADGMSDTWDRLDDLAAWLVTGFEMLPWQVVMARQLLKHHGVVTLDPPQPHDP